MWSVLKTKIRWKKVSEDITIRKIFQIRTHTRSWGIPFSYSYTGSLKTGDYDITISFLFLHFAWTGTIFYENDRPSTSILK